MTLDCSSIKASRVSNCLQSKSTFTSPPYGSYHITTNVDDEENADEDYPNVQDLFDRNLAKVFNQNNNSLFEENEILESEGAKKK